MNRYTPVVVVALALAACRSLVLPFDAGPPLDLDPSLTIDSLSDAQAVTVCDWLAQGFPGPEMAGGNPVRTTTCLSAATYWCGTEAMGWSNIDPSDCVLNLRHSPCEGTIGALQQCVAYYQQQYAQQTRCDGVVQACSEFWTAPGCDQTIFTVPGDFLPIAPDASCLEGGADGSDDGGGVDGG